MNIINLLKSLYGDGCYFIDVLDINKDRKEVVCNFLVPKDIEYTKVPVPYVTAENYIRCISQLLIAAVILLLEEDGIYSPEEIESPKNSFAKLRWFYREFESLQFRKLIPKGEIFSLGVAVKKTKRYKGNNFFIECEIFSESIIGIVKFCQLIKGYPYLTEQS